MKIGERIHEKRVAVSMSQATLANAIARNASAVSRIESDSRKVSASELASIATALDTTVAELAGERVVEVPFMALASQLARRAAELDLGAAASTIREMLEAGALLEQLDPSPRSPLPRQLFISPDKDVERVGYDPQNAGAVLAAELRRELDLGSAAIPEDFAAMVEETFDIDVLMLYLPESLSGVSVRSGSRSLAVLNVDRLRTRHRVTLAHMLAHHLFVDDEIILERDDDVFSQFEVAELRASSFALNFLLPPAMVSQHFVARMLDAGSVLELAFKSGLNFIDVVTHLHSLGFIDDDTQASLLSANPAAAAWRSGRSVDWDSLQVKDMVLRAPSMMLRKAITAYVAGRIGIGPLAILLQRDDVESLRDELRVDGVVPAFEL